MSEQIPELKVYETKVEKGPNETKLNVLIIGQYFPPDLGGAATRAHNAAKGLVLNGCQVTVLTAFPHYPHGKIPQEYKYKPFKVEWLNKIRVIRTYILPLESKGLFGRLLLFTSFALSSIAVLPIIGKVDVIWAANPDVFSIIPAMVYCLVKNKPIASNVDDLVIEDLYDLKLVRKGSIISRVVEIFARIFYAKTKVVTPISPGYINPIRKYGVDRKNIHVVRGGVDLSIFKPNTPKNGDEINFVVLYSGGFSIAYDFEQILKAAKIIAGKENNIEFVLQGKGELGDLIKTQIKRLNLKNVKVIDEVISREKVANLLNQADVLLLPLRDFGKPYLGISSKIYEYQAVGKPIICSAEGQPAKYLRETKSGIVVRPGDFRGLANSILYIYNNRDVSKQFGDAGRRSVRENLAIEKVGKKMMTVLQKIDDINNL